MNGLSLDVVIPVVSRVVGRDISPDVEAFFRARSAIGSALNEEGQKLFQDNWRSIPEFMESAEGKAAIVAFLSEWAKTLAPKINQNDQDARRIEEEKPESQQNHGWKQGQKGGGNRK